MEWKYVDKELPNAYKTGMWDGKKSDEVLAEDKNGKKYIAVLYSGFLDGDDFNDWYNNNDYDIQDVVRWCEIPD